MAGLPDVGRRMSFALVDAMAEMHLIDPDGADLSDARPARRASPSAR